MQIVFFGRKHRPVIDFIDRMAVKDQAKVLACLKCIEELGFECPRVEFRQIVGKLWEIKINASTAGYRIFYLNFKHELLVLLHAYKKQSQKTPAKEIEIAQRRLMEVVNNARFYLR